MKKKARSPILKGFGVDFSAVLKFTGQQYKTTVRKKLERVFLRTVILFGLMVKCTPERGHNALFFIPLEVIIML